MAPTSIAAPIPAVLRPHPDAMRLAPGAHVTTLRHAGPFAARARHACADAAAIGRAGDALGALVPSDLAIDPRSGDVVATCDDPFGVVVRVGADGTARRSGGADVAAARVAGLARLGQAEAPGTALELAWTSLDPSELAGGVRRIADAGATRSTGLDRVVVAGGVVHVGSTCERYPGLEHAGQIWALDLGGSTARLVDHVAADGPVERRSLLAATPTGRLLVADRRVDGARVAELDPRDGRVRTLARFAPSIGDVTSAGVVGGATLVVTLAGSARPLAIAGLWPSAAPAPADADGPAHPRVVAVA